MDLELVFYLLKMALAIFLNKNNNTNNNYIKMTKRHPVIEHLYI